VEDAWSKMAGRPVVVSPREFEAIDGWRRRGIPLAVVLETFHAASRKRSGRLPRSLTALSPAVEQAFAVVAAGRAGTAAEDPAPTRSDARLAWEAALARCAENEPLRGLLTRLLAEEAAGAEAIALDSALDLALPAVVSASQLAEAREETQKRLSEFRARMSDDELRSTYDRALARRLRGMLALPRVSLTR
jgi:hypothetical protein